MYLTNASRSTQSPSSAANRSSERWKRTDKIDEPLFFGLRRRIFRIVLLLVGCPVCAAGLENLRYHWSHHRLQQHSLFFDTEAVGDKVLVDILHDRKEPAIPMRDGSIYRNVNPA